MKTATILSVGAMLLPALVSAVPVICRPPAGDCRIAPVVEDDSVAPLAWEPPCGVGGSYACKREAEAEPEVEVAEVAPLAWTIPCGPASGPCKREPEAEPEVEILAWEPPCGVGGSYACKREAEAEPEVEVEVAEVAPLAWTIPCGPASGPCKREPEPEPIRCTDPAHPC